MSAVQQRLRASARNVPGVQALRRQTWRRRSVETIRASGLFDEDWYRLQTGRTDLTGADAVAHYVDVGRRLGLSPAPFFEPTTFDPAWKKRVEDPFARFIRDEPARRARRWHSAVVFEPDVLAGPDGRLRAPAPDCEVSLDLDGQVLSDRPLSWREVEEALRRRTARWRQQEDARLGSTRSRRPPEGEAAFRAAMAGRDVPAAADGEVLVSVVMPTWNRQAVVSRAVASVQAQTLTSWELVVVDDGSTDDTLLVLEGLSHFDPRVRVVRLGRSGVGRARNEAIARARGRYVAFLDSDNTWQPDFLELMLKGMDSTGSRAGFASIEMVAGDRRDYRVGGGRREQLLVGNHVDLNALVVRSDTLARTGGFAEDLRRTVDYDLVLKISEAGPLDFIPFVGVVYDDEAAQDSDRISVREPLTWDYVTRSRHLLDWETARERRRDAGRATVVMTTGAPRWATTESLRAVLGQHDLEQELQVLLVDRGSGRADTLALALLELVDPRVRVLRTPTDVGVPLALDVGAEQADGESVCLLPPNLVLEEHSLATMLAALADDPQLAAVQPVVVDARDLVSGAGAVLGNHGWSAPFLRGHARSELLGAPEVLALPALFGGALAARTRDVVLAHGLDPLLAGDLSFSDLSLRLSAEHGGRSALVTRAGARAVGKGWNTPLAQTDRAVFARRYAGRTADEDPFPHVGLEVSTLSTTFDRSGQATVHPLLRRRRAIVQEGGAAGMPSLRWALVTAAPAGPESRAWGDLHFAEALARALRRLGQDAHVYAREARQRANGYLDDVLLTLRGLDPVLVDPARLSMTWVISHPELVTDAELAAPDAVFAAGEPWARAASLRSGREVTFLPQCTDPTFFRPHPDRASSGDPARLFVGNSRRVLRPSVAHLVAAGVPLDVYGKDWEDLVPEGTVKGTYLPNEDLGSAYWDAGIVLNDHWADMREQGFISNRVFDGVAAGARMVSDYVEGLDELLPGAVQTWRTPQELLTLATAEPVALFGDDDDRRARAEAVRREHSFDARAVELLQRALELRGGQQ